MNDARDVFNNSNFTNLNRIYKIYKQFIKNIKRFKILRKYKKFTTFQNRIKILIFIIKIHDFEKIIKHLKKVNVET